MTIRLETTATGAPHTVWIDGTAYTPDELRQHLARSAALDTVIHWHADAEARDRRQRRLVRVLCHALRRLARDLPTHTAYLQRQHNRRLNADPAAPWAAKESR